MNFGNPASATATAVWNNTVRRLTGLGTATLTFAGNISIALANGGIANFNGGAGAMFHGFVVGIGAANVTWQIGIFDGTTFQVGTSIAAASSFSQELVGGPTIGGAIKNNGTVSGNYAFTGYFLTQ